jgi:CheY-like chemotaxis protein
VDCVLMDLQMPVMDGYTATARIRAHPGWAELPVIAMTANVMPEDREKVLQAGMNDHVAKPIVPAQLLATLRRWIRPPGGRTTAGMQAAAGKARTDPATDRAREPTTDGAGILPAHLPGIDLPQALRQIGGQPRLLARLLRDLRDDHRSDRVRIEQALETGDLATASRLAHTLKGVAGTLGAQDLQASAAALEDALRQGDVTARIVRGIGDATDELMQGLDAWLGSDPQAAQAHRLLSGPPQAAGVDAAWDDATLRGHLMRLHELLEQMDAESVELASTVLDQLHCRQAAPEHLAAARALSAHAARFEFDAARIPCQQLLQAFADATPSDARAT